MNMQCSNNFVAKIWGSLDLRDQHNTSRLPPGKKEGALLASLLVAPNMRRTRAWLQAILWAESTPDHSATNLRQALLRMRRFLGDDATILQSNRQFVWLDTQMIKVDAPEKITPACELFEGLDIGSQEFEDWLLMQRQSTFPPEPKSIPNYRVPKLVNGEKAAFFSRAIPSINKSFFEVNGAQPVIVLCSPQTTSSRHQRLARMFSNNLTNEILALETFKVHDQFYSNLSKDTSSSKNKLFVHLNFSDGTHDVSINISVVGGTNGNVIWHTSQAVSGEGNVDERHAFYLVCTRLLEFLLSYCPNLNDKNSADYSSAGDIGIIFDGLFEPGSITVDDMHNRLNNAIDVDAKGIHFGLRNCVRMLQFGERLEGFSKVQHEIVLSDLRHSFEYNRQNALVQCLASHAHSLFLKQNLSAIEHGKVATSIMPGNPICWVFLALAQLRAGNLSEAQYASAKLNSLGFSTRYRAFFQTVQTAIAVCNGKYNAAVESGEIAGAANPNFRATDKYLFIAFERLGKLDKAIDLGRKIQEYEPDFGQQWILAHENSVNIDSIREVMAESALNTGFK